MVSGQGSLVSVWSVVSMLSVVSVWSVASGKCVVSGKWSVVNGQLSVVSGQWKVVSGEWSVVSSQWSVVSSEWSLGRGDRERDAEREIFTFPFHVFLWRRKKFHPYTTHFTFVFNVYYNFCAVCALLF